MASAYWGGGTADQVDDFDEYDPTPYGGGYDLSLTFGRPLPPSDQTCHPISSSSSYGRGPQTEESYNESGYRRRPQGGEEYSSGGYERRPQVHGEETYGPSGYGSYGRKGHDEEEGYRKPKPYGEERPKYQSGEYERPSYGGGEEAGRYRESYGRKKQDDNDSDDERKSRYQKYDNDSDDEKKQRYEKNNRRRHDYDD